MIELLLAHGTVIPMDPKRSILEHGAVAVDQSRIVAVGPSAQLEQRYPAQRTLNCQGRVVIPGLIDAHGHGGHSLIKTIGSDTGSVWMKIATPTYFHYTTDDFWYVDGLVSALERLRAGVTCGVSVIASQPRSDDPIFACNHARAYSEVGTREIVAVGPCAPPWPHKFSRWVGGQRVERDVPFEEALAGAEAAIEAWNHGASDRIRVFITPFTIVPSLNSSETTPPDIAVRLQPHDKLQSRRIRDIAAKYKTRIHSDAFGGMVRLAAQDEYGLLGPDVHLQHCRGISNEEVGILARTDTRVGHSMSYGQIRGRCPAPELIEAGATVAITTDGTSPYVSFDMFQAMRKAQLFHQLMLRDPFTLPVGKLLEMATIDAARAVGWEDELGSLEPGKKADITIVNMRQPHLVPNLMPVHRLVYEAVGGDVETVIVDGNLVMENRRVLTVDEAAILDMAEAETRATIERAGLESHLTGPCWGQARRTFEREVELPIWPGEFPNKLVLDTAVSG
jgi:5-methylthioadenosine/S-adenosylhomocysteine deaminase